MNITIGEFTQQLALQNINRGNIDTIVRTIGDKDIDFKLLLDGMASKGSILEKMDFFRLNLDKFVLEKSFEENKPGPDRGEKPENDEIRDDLDLSDVSLGGSAIITDDENNVINNNIDKFVKDNGNKVTKKKVYVTVLAFLATGNDSENADGKESFSINSSDGTKIVVTLDMVRRNFLNGIKPRKFLRYNADLVKTILQKNNIYTSLARSMSLTGDSIYYGFVGSEYCTDVPLSVIEKIQNQKLKLDEIYDKKGNKGSNKNRS